MNRREFWASLCAALGYAVAQKTPAPLSSTYPKGPEPGETWWLLDDQPVMSEDGWTHFTTRYTAKPLPGEHPRPAAPPGA